MKPPNNGLALASMIVSIAGAVICCLGLPLGIAGLVMGIIARNRINASNGTQGGAGMALAGIIVGAVATVIGLGLWIFWIASALTGYRGTSSPYN